MQMLNYVQTDSEIVKGILSFDCVVGQKGCIYSDRNSLAKGKMVPLAKNRLISALTQKPKKGLVHGKVSLPKMHPQSNLAQTLKLKKVNGVKPQSKKIIKAMAQKKPSDSQNIQAKAHVNSKQTRDNALIKKQKELLKDINNPIDEIEQKLARQVKNKVTDNEGNMDLAKSMNKPSK